MPHYSDYKCADCGQVTLKDLLVAKKVVFSRLGPGAQQIKSRTIKWVCVTNCLEKDEDYQREAIKDSPGHKSPALERVRKAQDR